MHATMRLKLYINLRRENQSAMGEKCHSTEALSARPQRETKFTKFKSHKNDNLLDSRDTWKQKVRTNDLGP